MKAAILGTALGVLLVVPICAAETPERQFLIPLMMFGPNNQILAIKETLALAQVLGRTIAVPDLQTHYFTDKSLAPMSFRDSFDVPHMKSKADAILLEELPGQLGGRAWKRGLDAVLLLVPPEQYKFTPELIQALDLKAPPRTFWLKSPVTSWRGCTASQISELKKLLEPHQVVAVQTFHGLLYGSQWLAGPLLTACGDACCQAFKDFTPYLRKSPMLYEAADRFIHERLGNKPFVAAHIRPYPDPCLKIWNQEDTPERTDKLTRFCNNDYMLYRLAPSIKHLMDTYSVSSVFVMTHPKVRATVQGLLRKAGIEPVFMELGDVPPPQAAVGAPAGNVSFSMLAMVEEAVCIRAKAFVGTKESSMTGTIVQERIGHKMPPEDSYCFFGQSGYEKRPISVPQWYLATNFSTNGTARWRGRLAGKGLKQS